MMVEWLTRALMSFYVSGFTWICFHLQPPDVQTRDRDVESQIEEAEEVTVCDAAEEDPWQDSDSDGMYEVLPDAELISAMEIHEAYIVKGE